MKQELKTKFYEFTQNNSGRFFDVDENVCHRVIIEAFDENHAKNIFKLFIKNQSKSCACCGDRWSLNYPIEINLAEWRKNGYPVTVYKYFENTENKWFELYGKFPILEKPTWQKQYGLEYFIGKIYFETIEQYYQYMADSFGWTTPDARIHFLDGSKKEIFKSKNNKNNNYFT